MTESTGGPENPNVTPDPEPAEAAMDGGGTNGGDKSSTGLDTNLAGLLCYAFVFLSGIVFILVEKESRFVKFHAWQSTAFWGAFFAVQFILGIANFAIPCLPFLLSMLLLLGGLILWIVQMVKAYQGEMWKMPVVGDWAEKQV